MTNDPNFNNAPSPTQPLSNTPPAPAPNRTPFDTHLVDSTDVPRYTQPLPNSTVSTSTVTSHKSHLPSQVVPDADTTTPNYFTPTPSQPLPTNAANTISPTVTSNHSSPIATPQPPLQSPTAHLPASRIPTGTLLGLAAVGGALVVAFGSALFRRVAPTPPTTSTTIVETQRRNPVSTKAPTVVMQPNRGEAGNTISSDAVTEETTSGSSNIIIEPSAEEPANSGSSSVIREPSDESSRRASSSNTALNSDEEAGDATNYSSREERAAGVPATADDSDNDNFSTSDSASSNASSSTSANRDDSEGPSNPSSSDNARGNSSRYVERRREYSIQAPQEFRLTQSGRRTIWKGSGGAQILVEVAKNNGQSPRAGWESLDRTLSKKYGRAYTSRGIRETTVNGRRAAIWEFDLRQKNGTTVRKMDVAVVDKNNGYAVLVSAPVENFEKMRPTFERVVNSFQVGENATATESSDSDGSPEGF